MVVVGAVRLRKERGDSQRHTGMETDSILSSPASHDDTKALSLIQTLQQQITIARFVAVVS
jgi:hypothetical protein